MRDSGNLSGEFSSPSSDPQVIGFEPGNQMKVREVFLATHR